MSAATMKVHRTGKRVAGKVFAEGKSFVMYGRTEEGKWFERYFSTEEAAKTYASKRGWTVESEGAETDQGDLIFLEGEGGEVMFAGTAQLLGEGVATPGAASA